MLDQSAVVGAGVFAAFHQMAVLHKQRFALPAADHLHAVAQLRGKGQDLSEDAAGADLLQNGPGTGVVVTDQGGVAPDQDAHLPSALAVSADGLAGFISGLAHMEAVDHGIHFAVGDAPE